MAQSTTWTGAVNADWDSAGNWTAGVPENASGTSFNVYMVGPGNTVNVAVGFEYYLNTLQFPSGAPSFIIHIKNVDLTGTGVINSSGLSQALEVDAGHIQGSSLTFGNSTYGASTVSGPLQIINDGSTIAGDDAFSGGATTFYKTSSAGDALITNDAAQASDTGYGMTTFLGNSNAGTNAVRNLGGSVSGAGGGLTQFFQNSNAATTTIVNGAASAQFASGGETIFNDGSQAGYSTIINYGSGITSLFSAGSTVFNDSTSAASATITNGSGAQAGTTQFGANSTAGFATINNVGGAAAGTFGGGTVFSGATAGEATINNEGATASSASGGSTVFYGGTAGYATITNGGGAFFSQGGQTQFMENATAGNATIINNGGGAEIGQGGATIFADSSSAGAAILIANAGAPAIVIGRFIFPGGLGGSIVFNDSSTGGTAQVEVFGNGSMDISGHSAPGVTIGSLAGDGSVSLGANNLTVGSNNLSTTFSGVAQDGGAAGGSGGSITKIGTGTLTLSGTNSYTGATTVEAGTLAVDGSIASSSGVTVNAGGTLAGHGNVSNIGGAGTVSPGDPGILTANQVDPSGGVRFSFDFTKTGSPDYGDAAASGNSLLHLTGAMPFTAALTSDNRITIDFSGAALAAGEVFEGGLFTDTPTPTSMVSDADFIYTDTEGFTVSFDGFATEALAGFASGAVADGTVLEFEISGTGRAPTVPEPAMGSLLGLGLALLGFGHRAARRRDSSVPA